MKAINFIQNSMLAIEPSAMAANMTLPFEELLTSEGIYDLEQVIQVMILEHEGVSDIKHSTLGSKGLRN